MPRPLTDRHFELREWQIEARRATREKYKTQKDFLCVATPGSGKTKKKTCLPVECVAEVARGWQGYCISKGKK